MSSFSALISTRKNSWPFSVPTNGVSSGTPAPSRWAGVRVEPLTVTRPTRLPGGRVACTHGTCISDEVATGTPTAAAISFWNSDRKPQLVVMASAPEPHQILRRRDEIGQQARGALQHHLLGVAPLHDAVEHREGPGRAIAHVARNARKARLQHQDAERRAVDAPCRRGRCEEDELAG